MKFRGRDVNVFSISALDLFASALGAFILIAVVLMPYFLRVDREVVETIRMERDQARAELAVARGRIEQAQSALERAQQEQAQCLAREATCRQERDDLRRESDQLRAELARAKSAAEAAQDDVQRTQDELRQCQNELQVCAERLSKTFLAIVIQWPTERHDVDLHIIDPAGNEFSFRHRSFPGSLGKLSVDTESGPGVEIWEISHAAPGKYEVLYNLYRRHDNHEAETVVWGGVYYRDGHTELRERRLTEEGRAHAVTAAFVTVKSDGTVEIDHR